MIVVHKRDGAVRSSRKCGKGDVRLGMDWQQLQQADEVFSFEDFVLHFVARRGHLGLDRQH